jgi:hypothetical protein
LRQVDLIFEEHQYPDRQVHSAQTLRAKELKASGEPGTSQTMNVCRHEIEYIQDGVWMFCITLVDTPGFADTGGLDKDKEHVKKILITVSRDWTLDVAIWRICYDWQPCWR